MITETKEVYKCEHCRKLYQRKNACISHEPKCRKNPTNIPKCVGCEYLENIGIKYEPTFQTEGSSELFDGRGFRCKLKDVFMYHPVVELGDYGVPDYAEFKGDEIYQERMPTECKEWKDENEISRGIGEMFN